ncbi:MAG TPA: nucleotidyl transferase AbiEii/AbiGii toxin family protein, partial [Stellaceae bacterium]|nr:nucleotidyl transferase AbiEii/AbiGii toxin family protein [Stellaceae bacterium]
MIPEPQKTYVLELFQALGATGDSFVIAGAQAMKFYVQGARGTKDIDFVLDAIRLRDEAASLHDKLERLGYAAVPESRNFQFQKQIPGSPEIMRIEFMAPEEFKRDKDFRVDVQADVHARACTGGSIALVESKPHTLAGTLPDGRPFTASVRVTRPHALVMLKLLALDDRYRNVRGPQEAAHDREEARTHAADIVAILSAQPNVGAFRSDFVQQFVADTALKDRVVAIFTGYFRDALSPGLLLYEEALAANTPAGRDSRSAIAAEMERVSRPTIFLDNEL